MLNNIGARLKHKYSIELMWKIHCGSFIFHFMVLRGTLAHLLDLDVEDPKSVQSKSVEMNKPQICRVH